MISRGLHKGVLRVNRDHTCARTLQLCIAGHETDICKHLFLLSLPPNYNTPPIHVVFLIFPTLYLKSVQVQKKLKEWYDELPHSLQIDLIIVNMLVYWFYLSLCMSICMRIAEPFDFFVSVSLFIIYEYINAIVHYLTTRISSEKCVIR